MRCNKFEKLFLQDDETELLEHIKTCPDCKKEYEKFQKISSLVKETKPLYRQERFRKKQIAISLVAGFSLFILTGFIVLSWLPNYNYDKAVESELYPTDEYGLMELY